MSIKKTKHFRSKCGLVAILFVLPAAGCAKTRSSASHYRLAGSKTTRIVATVNQPLLTKDLTDSNSAPSDEEAIHLASTVPSAELVKNGSWNESTEPIVHFVGWQAQPPGEGSDQAAKDSSVSPNPTNSNNSRSKSELAVPTLSPQFHETESVRFTVEDCVQLAMSAHPKVAAARARLSAANNRIPQASALADPKLDNLFFPLQPYAQQFANGRMQDQVSLSQEVPWPEKLRARAAVAIREAQIAQTEVESIERDIAETVRMAYYELWQAERTAEIVHKNQELVASLIKVSEARYRSGGSQQDVLNAEIERERLQQQLLESASQKAAAQADLAALLQQPKSLFVTSEESLPIDELPTQLESLIAQAEQCNPELRGLGIQIQRDLQKQRLANLQRYSDFQFGTQYGFMSRGGAISPVADGVDNISFSVGMTLPVYRDKIRAGIREASANRVSSTQLLQAEQVTIEGRLRRLLSEIDSLDQQRSLFTERILPRSEQTVKIATSEYAVGKTTFIQLTDNYRELLMFQLQVVRIEASLANKLAQLTRTVGCR